MHLVDVDSPPADRPADRDVRPADPPSGARLAAMGVTLAIAVALALVIVRFG